MKLINIHDANAWGHPRIFKVYSREGDLYMWFYDNDDEVVSSLFAWNVCYSRCILVINIKPSQMLFEVMLIYVVLFIV